MRKNVLLFLILFPFVLVSHAQQFSKAVGVRGGVTSGIEYRFYTSDENAYKFLLSSRDRGAQVTVFKEFHRYEIVDFSEQLVFIFGVGLHAGFERWQKRHHNGRHTWYEPRISFLTGLDGLAALEYTFAELPVAAGMEGKPYFDIWGRETFRIRLFDFALTLKYLF
jgi:hypothetical protein